MVTIEAVAGLLVLIFGIMGAVRGWTKEIIATAGVILALFALNTLRGPIESFVPPGATPAQKFGIWAVLFLFVVFFSYQTPAVAKAVSRGKLGVRARAALQERILGMVIGLVNGYLVIGTIWYYLQQQGYPFPSLILPPINPATNQPDAAQWAAIEIAQKYLPLHWIAPWLPYLTILFFLFVIIALI